MKVRRIEVENGCVAASPKRGSSFDPFWFFAYTRNIWYSLLLFYSLISLGRLVLRWGVFRIFIFISLQTCRQMLSFSWLPCCSSIPYFSNMPTIYKHTHTRTRSIPHFGVRVGCDILFFRDFEYYFSRSSVCVIRLWCLFHSRYVALSFLFFSCF